MSRNTLSGNTQPRIAIIGGGPGGLTLLLTLHKRGIPATLYERDMSLGARLFEGGCLDLHWHTGQQALRENGLENAFNALARPEGDTWSFYAADGTELMRQQNFGEKPREELRPEIERRQLVRLLHDAVPADNIKWNHAFVSARALGDGRHEVTFANGTMIECDILVGADGGRSRVRTLLSDAAPIFSGVTGAELYVTEEAAALPSFTETAARVGKGMLIALKGGDSIMAQYQGNGAIRTCAWFRGPEDFVLPIDGTAARAAVRAHYVDSDWASWLLALIDSADPAQVFARPIYALPVGHRWTHTPGVTLLGDAAHLKSPMQGEGANLAMRDGLDLGVALAQAVQAGGGADAFTAALRVYEETMWVRGEDSASRSAGMLELMFAEDAPASVLKVFGEAKTP